MEVYLDCFDLRSTDVPRIPHGASQRRSSIATSRRLNFLFVVTPHDTHDARVAERDDHGRNHDDSDAGRRAAFSALLTRSQLFRQK